jgi:hypothetical protein
MTVEALGSGKPVSIFMLPQQSSVGLSLVSALNRAAGLAVSPHPAWRLAALLFETGILEAPADRLRFYRELIARDVLAIYPDSPARPGTAMIEEAHVTALRAIRTSLA